ncbi:hypothetical protein DFQ28_011590 [Apophysomyces sp. BC1034]|nr:hypothetical protein DFQ28_011590 [Apophysomyces sp. BC1034]
MHPNLSDQSYMASRHQPPTTYPINYSQQPVATQPLAPNFRPQQPKSTRPVIPSKRAAQNRAAQKAFRQRRDQYVKDLESKAKEMDQWKEEMDQLRIENTRLRETVAAMEKKLVSLTGEPITTEPASSPPLTSPSSAVLTRSSPPPDIDHASSFSPIPLRAPHLLPSDRSVDNDQNDDSSVQRRSDSAVSSTTVESLTYEPIHLTHVASPMTDTPTKSSQLQSDLLVQQQQQQQQRQPPAPDLWPEPLELDLDFDPFFEEDFGPTSTGPNEDQIDFISGNSGQVLDDLFAMLQTRQRPQIPIQPSTGFVSLGDPTFASSFDMSTSTSERS